MPYVVRFKDGTYQCIGKHTTSTDINDARVFVKKASAHSSVYRCPRDAYDVLECKLTLVEPIPMVKQGRPSWEDYLLGLAFIVSQRSHDSQTQHGCVITDKDNRIVGTGYNGFARGMKDTDLPNTRPDKYDWMIHSEINALANCTLKPTGGIAYITGEPCNPCLMSMWQHGIQNVVCGSEYCWQQNNEKSRKVFDKFLEMTGMKIKYVKPDLSWIVNLAGSLPSLLNRGKT